MSFRILLVQHCPHMGGSAVSATVTARALQHHGYDVDVVLGDDGPFVERFRQLGFRTWIVPHSNWLRPGGVIRGLKRWARELRSVRAFGELISGNAYSCVYVNTIVSAAAAVAARRCGIPCVWHIRELFDDVGGEMTIPRLGGRRLVRGMIWSHANQVIVNSRAVAENILATTEHERLSVIPNSVDNKLFEDVVDPIRCRQQFGLPANSLVVGVPGTLRPMKGHEFLLSAAAEMVKTMPQLVFAITGEADHDYGRELTQLADTLGIAAQVKFLGSVRDMRLFYAACDLICIPSRAEPFGRVAIEAFAAGRAVVAADVGGLREIIDNGVTGYLVPYNDAPALSQQMTELLRDQPQRNRTGNAARACAKERYTEGAYSFRVASVVDQLFARPRKIGDMVQQ